MLKGGESAESYLETSGLAKMLEDIMIGCCREVPDKLGPFIAEYLTVRPPPPGNRVSEGWPLRPVARRSSPFARAALSAWSGVVRRRTILRA